MNFLNYSSEEEEDKKPSKKVKLNVARDVDTTTINESLIDRNSKEITHNISYKNMLQVQEGPTNPFTANINANKNKISGYVEEESISDYSFKTLQRTFQRDNYTYHPDGTGFVGDIKKAKQRNGATIVETEKTKPAKVKRLPKGDPSDTTNYLGPWAGYEGEQLTSISKEVEEEEVEETTKPVVVPEVEAEEVPKDEEEEPKMDEKTIYHGKGELYDYLGRSYVHVPTDLGIDLKSLVGSRESFLPKKCIHTFTGHSKGVNKIEFFPNSGHLLLSGSLDNTIKIWDVYHDRKCLRTFMGHSKAVKDVNFNFDGKRFLSAGYDKWIKHETGQCVSSYAMKRIPNVVKFHPDENKGHTFLAGCADKKIYQFDTRTNKIVQEYNQHTKSVNTITFVDNNRRFVSTSDDKTFRAWEFGMPVVVKYIAEPDMHSLPAVSLSTSRKWLACTSLDNRILIYSGDRFKLNTKKEFVGHVVAGYACQPSWSMDDRFLCSGDSEGTVWFWDWKTCKSLKQLKGHSGVVIGSQWHPQEQSKVATCSWDGTIKYWD